MGVDIVSGLDVARGVVATAFVGRYQNMKNPAVEIHTRGRVLRYCLATGIAARPDQAALLAA